MIILVPFIPMGEFIGSKGFTAIQEILGHVDMWNCIAQYTVMSQHIVVGVFGKFELRFSRTNESRIILFTTMYEHSCVYSDSISKTVHHIYYTRFATLVLADVVSLSSMVNFPRVPRTVSGLKWPKIMLSVRESLTRSHFKSKVFRLSSPIRIMPWKWLRWNKKYLKSQ